MKKWLKISSLSFIIFLSIVLILVKTGESSKAATHKERVQKMQPDSIPKNPKVNIKVRKKFDNKGNLIGYDSSYSYEYISPQGEKKQIGMDSLMKQFQPFFFQEGNQLMHDPFADFFNTDSSYKDNFLDEHFFENQFNQNMFNFKEMFQQMDSLRTIFLKKQFPGYNQSQNNSTLKLPQKQKTKKKNSSVKNFY